MRALLSRFATVALLSATLLSGSLIGPASACGCGIYQPLDGDAVVFDETSLVRVEGGQRTS